MTPDGDGQPVSQPVVRGFLLGGDRARARSRDQAAAKAQSRTTDGPPRRRVAVRGSTRRLLVLCTDGDGLRGAGTLMAVGFFH